MKLQQEQAVVEAYLRRNGFRWTSQRRLIVRLALATHDHFTAEQMLVRCQKQDPRVSRATVYRTLSVLEEAGFVEGLDTGDGSRRFEHVLGHEHHDHMVCEQCGEIFEFVSDNDPIVRPWNAPSNAMIAGRPVWWRASLMAPSTASVPEFVRKTRAVSSNGAMAARRSDSSR